MRYAIFTGNFKNLKKLPSLFLISYWYCMLIACNTANPENYFDLAVLNCNMMMGFAGEGLQRELDQPSVKLAEGSKDQTVAMKRKEVIGNKIKFVENDLQKLQQLKETDDTKDMLQASLALYGYVLPVYKTEYVQLAKLYDEGASKEAIQALSTINIFPGLMNFSIN
jgi:hypothetical protein